MSSLGIITHHADHESQTGRRRDIDSHRSRGKAALAIPGNMDGELAPVADIRPESIASHEIYSAVIDGQPVGFYGLRCVGSKLQLEHRWVWPAAKRSGVGRALFSHACGRARALGFQSLEIESDPNAEGFYERMGARRAGVSIVEVAGQRRELPVFTYEFDAA